MNKLIRQFLGAMLLGLVTVNAAYAMNWPTCPAASTLSKQSINGNPTSLYSDDYWLADGGTFTTSQNQTWYVTVFVNTLTAQVAKDTAKKALKSVINNPFYNVAYLKSKQKNVYACRYPSQSGQNVLVYASTVPLSEVIAENNDD